MDNLEQKAFDFIEKNQLLSFHGGVLLAVSGGCDSMAMAHLLLKLYPDREFAIAHVDHVLREESSEDLAFVAEFAKKHNLTFYSKKVDIKKLAAKQSCGEEEMGRKVRYEFFRSLGYKRIFTAHHRDDQAETVLGNIIRGCGLKGLGGISPLEGDVARPLLAFSKEEILAYCDKEAIEYREDKTNADLCYRRNRIRHKLLPALEDFNPKIKNTLYKLAEQSRRDSDFFIEESKKYFYKLSERSENFVMVDWDELCSLHSAISSRIIRLATEYLGAELDFEMTEKIAALKNRKRLHFHGCVAEHDGKKLLFYKEGQREKKKVEPVYVPVKEGVFEIENLMVKREKITIFHKGDVAKYGCFPYSDEYVLRTGLPDDFYILPNGGKKTLKSFSADAKIPEDERQNLLVLAKGKEILWIVGYRFCCSVAENGDFLQIFVNKQNMDK